MDILPILQLLFLIIQSMNTLVNIAELTLSEAIKVAKFNTKSSEIGKTIENTIINNGLKPIQNLSGHSLDQYIVHAGKSIPNIKTLGSSFSLVNNQVICN